MLHYFNSDNILITEIKPVIPDITPVIPDIKP